jgi:glutamine synthetase
MSVELPEGTHTVELAVPDAFGVLRGKRVPASSWPTVAVSGLHMCSVIFSWTPRCEIRDSDEWLPPERGWPDMHVRPMPETIRAVPWRPGSAMVLCDVTEEDGNELAVSPRRVLQSVVDRAADMGFVVNIGFEIEFYLLDAQTLEPRHGDIQCYGIARGSEYEPVLAPMRNQLVDFEIPIEASNTEYAPGQVEVNVRYGEALATADRAVLFRNAVREIAAQHGYVASFMAKIRSNQSGSGLHLHHSLWRDGRNAFAEDGGLSELGRHYLGGLQQHMAEFSLFGSPTPNAFKRRQPYSFCPMSASWGIDNRTTGLRVIEGADSSVRIEQRDGSADANPYLIMAAQIAAGLDGVEHGVEPGPRQVGDAYAQPSAPALPMTVPEAAALLEKSELAAKVFGDKLVSVVCGLARHEHMLINSEVSEVERARYLDAF